MEWRELGWERGGVGAVEGATCRVGEGGGGGS